MERKDLVVKKNDKVNVYLILGIVFLLSLVFSVAYFSSNENKHEGVLIAVSGDNSGEIIFINEELQKLNKNNIINENNSDGSENIGNVENTNIVENNDDVENNDIVENTEVKEKETDVEKSNNEVNQDFYVANRILDKNKPMVALTFDDGPDPVKTLKVINILKKYNARATFFDIGNLMDKYPSVVKAEVESGCDVGGHSYSHANLNELSKSDIIEEVSKMEDSFRNATGLELKYVRPTYGNANKLVRETVQHPLINWCVDSLDWKTRDADQILEEIYKTDDFDGKIIIMHIIYDSTIEAVEKLIPDLINKGYQLVTISEMAEYKEVELKNGELYYHF